MADVYVERSSTGFFGNLGNAIKGVLVGLVLFVLSLVINYAAQHIVRRYRISVG